MSTNKKLTSGVFVAMALLVMGVCAFSANADVMTDSMILHAASVKADDLTNLDNHDAVFYSNNPGFGASSPYDATEINAQHPRSSGDWRRGFGVYGLGIAGYAEEEYYSKGDISFSTDGLGAGDYYLRLYNVMSASDRTVDVYLYMAADKSSKRKLYSIGAADSTTDYFDIDVTADASEIHSGKLVFLLEGTGAKHCYIDYSTYRGDDTYPGAALYYIPEPGTLVLLGMGSLGLLLRRRRR